MSKWYPLLFQPIYKELIWGGARMAARYERELPSDSIGESWDVSCRDDDMSVVENGVLAGRTLGELIAEDRAGLLGTALCGGAGFPLLTKIIDAKDNLSVQVHPGDAYALEKENLPYGKTEMWYILDAPEGAALIIGLKDGVTKEDFRRAVEAGTVEDCLGRLPIAAGDVIFIPAGLVHAITAGVMLAEIQQNSDTTYRMYDYNRLGLDGKPRELHVAKSIDVTDFDGLLRKETVPGLTVRQDGMDVTYYIACPYFAMEKLVLDGRAACAANGERFVMLTCTEGQADVVTDSGRVTIVAGQTTLLPAAMGAYVLEGKAAILRSYVPDVEHDFVQQLLDAGYKMTDINEKTAVLMSV